MKHKRSILNRITDIIATPGMWFFEREPVTQFVMVIGFFLTIIIVTGILHEKFHNESDCQSRLDICIRQYNTCMENAK